METETAPPLDAAPAERSTPQVGIKDVLCVGPIVLSIIYGYASTPLGPSLIGTHPVLLSALRGSISAIITTGAFASQHRIPLWQALVAPIFVLMVADPFVYWAGRRYGRRILDFYSRQDPRWARRIERGERFFARWGVWTIVFSGFLTVSAVFYLAAGEARMRFWVFLVADLVGALLWVGMLVGLGWSLGQRGVTVAETISHYGLYLTVGLIGVTFVMAFLRARRLAATQDV